MSAPTGTLRRGRAETTVRRHDAVPKVSGEFEYASDLEVERAGALVRGFVAAGTLPSGLSAGIERRDGERVRFLLRLLADARPHDRFGAAAGAAVQP